MTKRRLKVAHLTTVDMSLRLLLLDQLKAIETAGYEVHGVSSDGPDVETIRRAGIPHHAVEITRRLTPVRDLVAVAQLVALFRREHFDIVHTHTPKGSLLGQLAARLARVPMVVDTVHGFPFMESTPAYKRVPLRALARLAARCSDRILSQSAEDVAMAVRERIGDRRRWSLLGNGIDLERFDPRRFGDLDRLRMRKELGIRASATVLAFVGRLNREKGVPELIEAFSRVASKHPDLHLVLVGPSDTQKADAVDPSVAASYGCAAQCHFLGRRSDVPEILHACDILVLPSHREGVPRAPMEAAAMALPAIVTQIRGCREVVVEGETGLLVPVRRPDALANAITKLVLDKDLRLAMGEQARRRAESHFDQRRVFATVLATYASLVQERETAGFADARPPPAAASVYASTIKRAIDVVVSGTGLAATLPLIGGTAAVVALALGRPVLFRQTRPGRDGKPFELFKFRSMSDGRDAHGEPLPDAERLGRVGRFLRSSSLDELPTFWNVLRGDMSLIGPRPLLMEYLPRYSKQQSRRHEVRPGVTGYAQVHGRNEVDWARRLALDVEYVERISPLLDAWILWRTVAVVLARQGISAKGEATMRPFQGEGNQDAVNSAQTVDSAEQEAYGHARAQRGTA